MRPLSRGVRVLRRMAPAALLAGFAGSAYAQQFVHQVNWIPGPLRWTEGVECADVENDGDLDIFFADGNGFSTPGTKQQNVLIINRLELGPGQFTDESLARLGNSISNAKMVITGDIQNDGFVDALFCNGFNTDIPFLFVNNPANPGFFSQQSVARGLATPLNSASGQFGDLDNDGDLDLILCDSGPSFFGGAGGRPRLYFNNGNGFFTENAPKLNAPLKGSHMDVQFVDMDNNWTLDFFGACRQTNANGYHYLMLNDGTGTFTDVSTLIPNTSGFVYEAEVGDLDGDTDLDFFFVSINGSQQEGIIRNNFVPSGNLTFTLGPGFGGQDDNEIAFLDYDNDGDYDVIVGSLAGNQEKLYRYDPTFAFTQIPGAFNLLTDPTLDVAVADLDNNGTYDVVSAQGEGTASAWQNKIYLNNGTPDTLPPVIVREEPLASPTSTGPWVVRTAIRDQVLDDAKNWVTGSAEYVVNTTVSQQTVSITGFTFPPTSVPAGTTVTWVNNSGMAHDVTSTNALYPYASGLILPGQSFSRTFVRPGTYNYTCTLHPGMNGVITVTGATTPAKVTYSAGQIYRVEMTDTTGGNGAELVWETRFRDWAGNIRVSTPKRVPLPRSCGFEAYGVGISPVNDLNLVGSGSGAIGGSAILTVTNATPFGSFYAISLGQFSFPLWGGVWLVDPTTVIGPFFEPTVGSSTVLTVPIPPNPPLVGFNVYFQAAALDPTKVESIALSNGLKLKICP